MSPVLLSPESARQLQDLPLTVQARMLQLIERLQHWPQVSGAKPLRGELAGHFRMRTGDYRLQFHLSARRIIIEKIGHRDGFYED
jgi:mRNA-degrading endonuclease RelE of RelBE toxin-antitoxin system